MKKFILTTLFAFVVVSSFALSFQETESHLSDWNRAFGLEDTASKNNALDVFKEAQDIIDHFDDAYGEIREECPWFDIGGRGNHRVLFHWGFNGDPAKHKPLLDLINKCLSDAIEEKHITLEEAEQYREEETQKLLNKVLELQAWQNKCLIYTVEKVFGIAGVRRYPNAIATLIHDIHILGDHTTIDTDNIMGLDAIRHDVDAAGFGRLFEGAMTDRLYKIKHSYDEDMKKLSRMNDTSEHSQKRKLLQEMIEKYLPAVLTERVGNLLKEKGITITDNLKL